MTVVSANTAYIPHLDGAAAAQTRSVKRFQLFRPKVSNISPPTVFAHISLSERHLVAIPNQLGHLWNNKTKIASL